MYNEKQMESIPGRAPVDAVWKRIEKQLNKKMNDKIQIPDWCYAVAVFSLLGIISAVVSVLFT